jgi:hypothetical protein
VITEGTEKRVWIQVRGGIKLQADTEGAGDTLDSGFKKLEGGKWIEMA